MSIWDGAEGICARVCNSCEAAGSSSSGAKSTRVVARAICATAGSTCDGVKGSGARTGDGDRCVKGGDSGDEGDGDNDDARVGDGRSKGFDSGDDGARRVGEAGTRSLAWSIAGKVEGSTGSVSGGLVSVGVAVKVEAGRCCPHSSIGGGMISSSGRASTFDFSYLSVRYFRNASGIGSGALTSSLCWVVVLGFADDEDADEDDDDGNCDIVEW